MDLPCVFTALQNVLRFWLERGVDGIRVDAVGNMMVYEDYYRDEARSYAPGKESVRERERERERERGRGREREREREREMRGGGG